MNVKNAFLNDFIMKEVYVEQPGFENFHFFNHVFKLKKKYRVWFKRSTKSISFFIDNGFNYGKIISS